MLTMTSPDLRAAIADYLRELADESIPLDAPLAVACVIADICRLAALPLPAEVAAVLGEWALPTPAASPTGGR